MNEIDELFEKIKNEIDHQEGTWGSQKDIPDDRWMEIIDDDYKDLKWAVRTRNEIPKHTMGDERLQTLTMLIRWHLCRMDTQEGHQ